MVSIEGGQHKRPVTPIPRRLQLFRLGSVHLFFFACAFARSSALLLSSSPTLFLLTPSSPFHRLLSLLPYALLRPSSTSSSPLSTFVVLRFTPSRHAWYIKIDRRYRDKRGWNDFGSGFTVKAWRGVSRLRRNHLGPATLRTFDRT